MTFKLATAAAMVLASATASNAADLAKKAPAAVDYVKVCDTYGAGFFYIPGSETCLKIGGYVRVNFAGGDSDTMPVGQATAGKGYYGSYNGERDNPSFTSHVRFLLSMDARSMTEYGLLRAYSELEFNTKSGSENGDDIVGKAFIQWGGWSAGHKTSNWDYYTGSAMGAVYGQEAHDDTVTLLSYTFGLGNGVTATVGIEDPSYAGRYNDASLYGGVKAPDVVANINVTQAWGSAQVMGALHDNYAAFEGKLGWAIGGGVTVNLPMLGAGDTFSLQAAYAKGANSYVAPDWSGVWNYDFTGGGVAGSTVEQTTAWSIGAGLTHNWTKTVSTSLEASYAKHDAFGAANDYAQIDLQGNVVWAPVSGLTIGAELEYRKIDNATATGLADVNALVGLIRVQRNF